LTANTIGLPPGVDPTNVYYTDLSAWGLSEAPHFMVQLDADGAVAARLEPAREPDWQVVTEWRIHEYWWMANGGSAVAGCDPTTNRDPHCDLPWRSFTQLTDTTNDTAPAGIEPGNLTSLGNLTGATLVAMDAWSAHYVYRRTITAHDVAAGRVTVDADCDRDGTGGLGWGSKYYVENLPALLDQPGEWWYDATSGQLYLWAPGGGSPVGLGLEISRRTNGFDLTDRSYVALEGLTIELYNDAAYRIDNEGSWRRALGDSVRQSTLRYANVGILLYQWVGGEAPDGYAVDGFVLEDSEVAYMDTSALTDRGAAYSSTAAQKTTLPTTQP
jgi:hypothetical protein